MSMTIDQLAEAIGARVEGDGSAQVRGCATLDDAGPADVSFFNHRKYTEALGRTRAAAVVLAPADRELAGDRTVLIADDAYFAFRQAVVALVGFREQPPPGVSPHAIVDDTASIDPSCHVGPFAVVGPGARVGPGTVVHAHAYIGADARIGRDGILYPHVTVYDRCVLGDRVTLHAGCVIGQDGFGYATHAGQHHKIPQTGNAVIEDDVEMGANCSVDRATLGSTVVGAGTKFSNSVTIGHGTRVGRHNLFVAQVGLAGSVETGDYVAIGGQTGIAGHLRIGHRAQIAACSGVMHDVPDDAAVGGTPAIPLTDIKRVWLHSQRLPDLVARIKRLERQLDQLRERHKP